MTKPCLRNPPTLGRSLLPALLVSTLAVLTACAPEVEGNGEPAAATERSPGSVADANTALITTVRNATAMADSIEGRLRPVPLMTTADEEALRRYSNAANVRIAQDLGVRPPDDAAMRAALADGRLVELEDSTEYWVLRRSIQPYVTPDTYVLLERIGEAFQDRLEEMGLPRFRYEISSVLRTAEQQARLRRSNPNAAAGTSAHEFGTTVDIVYEAYPAPADLPDGLVPDAGQSAEEQAALELITRTFMERMAARKSRELQAIMGEVMLEAQSRGDVLVTLERQQPVYHITVAKRLQ